MQSKLKETLLRVYGKKAQTWLESLPDLLAQLAREWQFTIESEFPNLSYNYALKVCLENGERAVLKCGVPNRELTTEIAALKHLNGKAAIRLLKADAELGAMLLEEAMPGKTLSKINNEDNTVSIFSSLMTALHHPINDIEHFPTVQKWFDGFHRFTKQFPGKESPLDISLVDHANKIGNELLDSMGELVLLHGDLHHENILSATREPWLAIDPKGVIGEREYEVGAFMRNPIPILVTQMNTKQILLRRLDLLVELTGFDRKRLWGWSFSQAVLAAIWCLEDTGSGFESFIQCADYLNSIKIW